MLPAARKAARAREFEGVNIRRAEDRWTRPDVSNWRTHSDPVHSGGGGQSGVRYGLTVFHNHCSFAVMALRTLSESNEAYPREGKCTMLRKPARPPREGGKGGIDS